MCFCIAYVIGDCCRLSISKWIHLNCEDEGLMRFFMRVHSVLRKGGAFVLEPQEWESYHKARRMNPVRHVPSFHCPSLTGIAETQESGELEVASRWLREDTAGHRLWAPGTSG